MTLPPLQLVIILTCAITALFFLFGWWFIFRRSLAGIFLTFMGMLVRREKPLPPRDQFVPAEGSRLSDVLQETGAAYTFDQALQNVQGEKPMQAQSAQVDAPMSEHLTTSDIGYPRPLSETEIDNPRPFLKIHLDDKKDNQ